MADSIRLRSICLILVLLKFSVFGLERKRPQLGQPIPPKVPPHEPRQVLRDLIFDKSPRRNRENIVQFIEGLHPRLRQEQENQDASHDVEDGVERERPPGSQRGQYAWKRQRENRGPEVCRGNGEAHADFSVGKREHFGRVGVWNRSIWHVCQF